MPVQVSPIYSFHPSNALIVTDNWYVYNYILWPLNDPNLQGNTLYAYLGSADTLAELQRQFPSRTFYQLHVSSDGGVSYNILH